MTQWRPERETPLDEAAVAIRSTGYDGPLDSLVEIAAGWDNTVLLADDVWAFRVPRRAIALPGIEREIAWLPHLARHLDVPVPDPRWSGRIGEPPWPFWGARLLPGVELATTRADRVDVATAVGAFLRRLHDLPVDVAGLVPLPVDPMARGDASSRAGRAGQVLDDLVGLDLWRADPATRALLGEGSGAAPRTDRLVLSHGDLYARHVLVDPDGTSLAGIIDWGDVCVALPSVDLSVAWSAFRGAARAALLDAYGPVDDDLVLRARVMAAFSTASVAAYAHDVGDPLLLDEALTGLAGITAD